jgi:hypothetical protein
MLAALKSALFALHNDADYQALAAQAYRDVYEAITLATGDAAPASTS